MRNIFIISIFVFLCSCKTVSQGDKIGVIVKCANEGFIFTTYECEIIRGGMTNASGTIGQSFHFTVEDKSLIPLFEKALNTQAEIKLSYHKEFVTFLWRTETHDNSFADKIEFMNGN